jgi:hypothetical protein
MSTLAISRRTSPLRATCIVIGQEDFTVCMADGRRITVPYWCYPRLDKAEAVKRRHFEIYSDGKMIHWPEIDEDIEVQHLVEGRMPVKADKSHAVVAEGRGSYSVPTRRKRQRQ